MHLNAEFQDFIPRLHQISLLTLRIPLKEEIGEVKQRVTLRITSLFGFWISVTPDQLQREFWITSSNQEDKLYNWHFAHSQALHISLGNR